ncbi:hypothetical protein [Burkholderia ambifaria]|uniref:Uncharacterized protein n=1 Tax=Burkholderia ambifaria MEX-5 TaxID=396597 RepID=B1T3J7_9BURK|nr:hypothetical protein [Burkholderia ambifaria]EDT41867.1 hypothetical protein BamMEX5DRAFT_2367 [Burkholderia ambifaria MEX-5]
MADKISALFDPFGNFHDWYIDGISTEGSVGLGVPDTFILSAHDGRSRARLTFEGVTRLGFEAGGLLNIVNALEVVLPGTEAYAKADALLSRSAHGERHGQHVVYLYSTLGVELAVEFDRLRID